ncbi:guanine nucleotide-binding protein subunit alpha [Castilleja foliolosa]|uniref:Guanine nucleotide-binding protein alpha subunit n=1 Tax=Castilleja foliolosa TaxID=1961234 RepID=A0ABD3ENL7_9LAMI
MYGRLAAAKRSVQTAVQCPRLTRFSLHPPKSIKVEFDNGIAYNLSAEYLRVYSPAVDSKIRSIGGEKVISGRRHVGIMSAEPVGNYGMRLLFDDLHKTGIFTWDYFNHLDRQRHSRADFEDNEQIGAGDSGKSTIFKQIKLLFQSGFDEAELKNYVPVIHANVYQTIKILHDGSKELSQSFADSSKFIISDENKKVGEKLSEIGGRLNYPRLSKELAQEIETLWRDNAIQETYSHGNELQVPDCTHYFMENLQRLSDADYVPTKEDVLNARVRTTGVVEIQFSNPCSPVGENKKSGEVYRLFDVGGQKNERRKWIHLFEGVSAVIFCTAISEYDQTLFEDDNKNRMMETKELFEWVLKQPCFEKTSFMLFLNKFDLFEKKVPNVPLSVCEWFKDYQPVSTGKQETENAYEFVKKKFEEVYFQNTAPDGVDRVFKIYRTSALDKKLVKKTFKLVDETLRRRNLFEAGLL